MKAVITGATKGIGRAITELLAAQGFDLALCARTAADLDALAQQLRHAYPAIEVLTFAADLSQKEQVKAFAQYVCRTWSSLDVLVNNAGVFLPCNLSDTNNESAFEQMIHTNVMGVYYLTRDLLPLLHGQAGATIFNLCSVASFMPYGAYAVSKHALLGFSRALRDELKEQQIRVTAVMPGAVLTPSWAGTDLPESRFMQADDIAKSIWSVYQLSPQTVVEELILRPQLGDI